MALSVLNTSSGQTSNSGASATINFTMTTSSGAATTALLVLVSIQGQTTDVSGSITANWDSASTNQAMTLVAHSVNATSGYNFAMFGLVNPTVGAGLNCKVAGLPSTKFCDASGINFGGAQSAVGTAFINSNTASGNHNESLTISGTAGDIAVQIVGNGNGWSALNQTTFFNNDTGDSNASNYGTLAGASLALTATDSGVNSAFNALGIDVAAGAANNPFTPQPWMWDMVANDPWRPKSENLNSPFIMLGGKVPTKFWRWDYNSGASDYWAGTPLASDVIPLLTQQKISGAGGQVKTKFWRWDYVPDPPWAPTADTLNANYNLLGGQVPTKFWRYDYDSNTWWQGTPDGANFNLLGGKVPTKFWRWDHVPEPPWLAAPSPADTLFMLVEGGTPFAKLWRYDHVPPPDWLGTPLAAEQTLLAPVQTPFFKLWRYDYVPPPDWLGTSLSAEQMLLAPAQTPFSKLWRYDYDAGASNYWQGVPDGANYNLLGGQVPTKFWRWDHVPSPDWLGTPIPSVNVFTAEPFSKFWRYDYVPPSDWLGTPQPADALFMLVEGGTPKHRLWRYDYDSSTWWQGTPVGSNFNILGGKVRAKFWRWDHVPEPVWQGAPIIPDLKLLTQVIVPFVPLDYAVYAVSFDSFWLGVPTAVSTSILGPSPPTPTTAIEWILRARRRHNR